MRKQKMKISLAVLFVLVLSTSAFANTGTIENNGDNKYKSVRLTPEIYNNANADLSDILIKDKNGENVPYFINTSYMTIYKESASYPMTLINSYVRNDDFYFDYEVDRLSDGDTIATSIEVATYDADFAKKIELFGSYDNIHWDKVQDDTLYSVDGKTKMEITFSSPKKYTNYRFKLDNNLERISFSYVKLNYSRTKSEKGYFAESIKPKFTTEEKDKQTFINIEGLKNLRLGEIMIETDSMFKRTASASFGVNKEIYNLSFGDTTYTDTAIPLGWQTSQDDILTVTIQNYDDKPIDIAGITVTYYADELVFEGKAGETYTLDFGVDVTKKAPVYDIAAYKDEILKGDIDVLSLKDIKITEAAKEELPKQYDFKVIFNVVVVIIAILLGFVILLNLRKKS